MHHFFFPLQPQFSSTPSLPQASSQGGLLPAPRQVLGSLASQENVRQHQVLFRGPAIKKSAIPVPSPLSSHSVSANSSGTPTSTSGSQGKLGEKALAVNWLVQILYACTFKVHVPCSFQVIVIGTCILSWVLYTPNFK